MAARRSGSIRLWQTELFLTVIVVAILILSGSLSAGLKATLTRLTETNELQNAAAFAQRLEPEFPLGADGTRPVREIIAQYRDVYGGGIWVYDEQGQLLESAHDADPLDAVLEAARLGALGEEGSFVMSEIESDGWIVAGKPLLAADDTVAGVVVTASSAEQPAAILDSVRDRLWVTFWTSLVVAGLLGFVFAEFIARRIRALSRAAAAIEAGDFSQELPTSLVPGEIQDLATSYNSMAARLGEAFEAVEAGRAQIEAVVRSMAEGVLALDAQETVQVSNPEAARLLGRESDQLEDAALTAITDHPAILDLVRASLAGRSASATIELGRRMVLLNGTPLTDHAGHTDGAVLLLADVTERHRLEDAQRRFVADASHEMRTPVAAVKGMLELLADGAQEDPKVREDFIHTMQAEIERLGRLVSDLLTLARLESGSLELRLEPELVRGLLHDVTAVMQTIADRSDITLEIDVDDPSARVMADRDRVIQVLVSFTDNALKHAPRGTTVRLGARRIDDRVRMSVSDEGPGVDPDDVPRLFERFYRADASRSGGGGAGLGLAIAKELVEAHEAEIAVTSEPGEGTTFSFDLRIPEA